MGVTCQVALRVPGALLFTYRAGRYCWVKSWISQFGDLHELKKASKYSVFWAQESHVARKNTGFPVIQT